MTSCATTQRGSTVGFSLAPAWWPVAFGREVAAAPISVNLAGTPLCLYRDGSSAVRAVLDSCPHRRLPLSMGRVTPTGEIQCGYHGWCFDGATGRCTAIPNLGAEERVSPSIRVAAFRTAERLVRNAGTSQTSGHATTAIPAESGPADALTMFDTTLAEGLVHIWTGDRDTPSTTEAADEGQAGLPLAWGRFEARVPVDLAADTLAANPGAALGLGVVLGAGEEVVRPIVDEEVKGVHVHRERRTLDVPRVGTFEPHGRRTVRVTSVTSPVTGLTTVVADSGDGSSARVVAALTPLNGFRTVVRWHLTLDGSRTRRGVIRTAAAARGRIQSGRSFERIADGLSVHAIDPGVQQLRELRRHQ